MSEEKLPAVAQNTAIEKASDFPIQVPKEWQGFTEDEALGGMAPVFQGYVKKYKYFMYSNNAGGFAMIDNEADKEIFVSEIGQKIKSIILFAHHVKVLQRGHVERLTDSPSKWPEEMKEVLAMSYDDASPGNFIVNNFENYLKKPDREFTSTKLYVIAIFPDLPSGWEPVICSFGITSDSPKRPNTLATARLALNQFNRKSGANLPLQFVYVEMFFVADKNANDETYQRPGFSLPNKEGIPFPAWNSVAHYKAHHAGEKLVREVIRNHEEAVKAKELDKSSAPTKQAESQYNNSFDDLDDQIPFR